MKLALFLAPLAVLASALPEPATLESRATVKGFDISHYQASVDFKAAYKSGGLRFVMIKATKGTTYKDPKFSSHYTKATSAGFIRGGYHFANPSTKKNSGQDQAAYFARNGGGWTADGITLPGMLDLESGSSSQCWGLSDAQMVTWISDFVDEYHKRTKRYPIIYTSPSWWQTCTANSKKFSKTCPLDLAAWSDKAPSSIPGGWASWTFWQNSDTNKYGGDSDVFNGKASQLKKLATG